MTTCAADKLNFSISSNTLMSNKTSTVTVSQSKNEGIRFFKNDTEVFADTNNVISTQNCTVIGNPKIQIGLIEHFMAALAICNIGTIDVEISENEMRRSFAAHLFSVGKERNCAAVTGAGADPPAEASGRRGGGVSIGCNLRRRPAGCR